VTTFPIEITIIPTTTFTSSSQTRQHSSNQPNTFINTIKMQFSLLALPVLALFAAAAPTSVDHAVEKRQNTAQLQNLLVDLTSQVKGFSTNMKSTADAVPANASDDEKAAAAQSVIADITSITSAFSSTNSQISALQQKKRDLVARQGTDLSDLPTDILGQLNGNPIVFANLLVTLIRELNPAVTSVLRTLNLSMSARSSQAKQNKY
jgi:hypothetical protein